MKKIKYSQFKHGQRCTCEIEHIKITDARISNSESDVIYICQNEKGLTRPWLDKLGYEQSWYLVGEGEDFEDGDSNVTNLVLLNEKPRTIDDVQKGDVITDGKSFRVVFERLGDVVFASGVWEEDRDKEFVEECKAGKIFTLTYHVNQLKKDGYKIHTEDETIEIDGKTYDKEKLLKNAKEAEVK